MGPTFRLLLKPVGPAFKINTLFFFICESPPPSYVQPLVAKRQDDVIQNLIAQKCLHAYGNVVRVVHQSLY